MDIKNAFKLLLKKLQAKNLEKMQKRKFGANFCSSNLRVYAQTSFCQENLAFCFQLCTVTHFVGFLPLPWFSCSLVFFPYSCNRFGGFFVSCMEKNVGGLYLFGCKKLYLTDMFEWLLSYITLIIFFKKYISIWSLFHHLNNSKKTKQLLGF